MQRVDGIIPRRDFPPGVHARRGRRATLCTNALDVLIDLHRVDVDATPLARDGQGRPGTSSARSPAGRRRFRNARTEDVGDYETVMAWLAEHQPDDVAQLRDPQRLPLRQPRARRATTRPAPVGVLDWEMATVGDPLMDLGGTLAYWVQDDDDEFFRQFRRQPTQPARDAVARRGRRLLLRARRATRVTPGAVAVLRGLRAVPARRDRAADLLPLLPRADHQRGLRDLRPGRAVPRAALPRDHRGLTSGPAAAGAPRPGVVGRRRLRRALRDRLGAVARCSARRWPPAGSRPTRWCTGGMRRHRETAEACLGELGPAPAPEVDAGWDEFDHVGDAGRACRRRSRGGEPTKAEFQAWFEAATDRWTGGRARRRSTPSRSPRSPTGSARRCVVRRRRRRGPSLVFTSGGPISWAAAQPARRRAGRWPVRLWRRLNPVCVNSGVTRVVTGRRGTTLVTFNEHAHLDGVPGHAHLPLTRDQPITRC